MNHEQFFKHRLDLGPPSIPMAEPGKSAPSIEPEKGTLKFIGTATVLISWAGFTIMTDPNFLHKGDHVHLGPGVNSMRLSYPAISLEDLPPIDCVFLSHFHEDRGLL